MDGETLFWLTAPGLGTGLGGLGLLFIRSASGKAIAVLLGFTAGVMLAATAFSLLVPALDRGTLIEVLIGFGVGAAAIMLFDRFLPHEHEGFEEGGRPRRAGRTPRERSRLLLAALTIHNVPEGMAVGVAFAAGGTELGIPIALAIGIQNIPEGFAAAAPLRTHGVSRWGAAGVALLTGLVEPPAAIAAFAAFELVGGALTGGLAFAAGAMLYVIVDELVPESHGHGNERSASLALIGGFALMMALDNAF